MAPRMNLGGQPPQEPESAPKAKPRAKSAAPRNGGVGGGRSSASATPPPPKVTGNDAKLRASIERMYSMIGIGMTGFGQARGDIGISTAGVNVVENASETADAWIELAQQNDRVRQALNGLVSGSVVANLIGCHVAMIAPVLASRGAVPAEFGAMFLSDGAGQYYMSEVAKAEAAAAARRNGTPA